MIKARAARPLGPERLHRLDDDRCLLDRVHGAALAPGTLEDLCVSGTAGDGEDAVLRASAGHPDLEARCLGDDARVGLDPPRHDRRAARTRRLLVGVRRHEQVAGELDTAACERLGCERHRSDAALHVARAAPAEVAVSDLGLERVARPALDRLHGDSVDVTVEEEGPTAACAFEAGDELGTSLEAEAWGHERLPRHLLGRGLPEIDLRPGGAQPTGQVLLQRRLLSRRIFRVARGRVEANEVGGELHELVRA